jgi:hypothetical protein
MMIEANDFRNAMSLLTSAVNVVTTAQHLVVMDLPHLLYVALRIHLRHYWCV